MTAIQSITSVLALALMFGVITNISFVNQSNKYGRIAKGLYSLGGVFLFIMFTCSFLSKDMAIASAKLFFFYIDIMIIFMIIATFHLIYLKLKRKGEYNGDIYRD